MSRPSDSDRKMPNGSADPAGGYAVLRNRLRKSGAWVIGVAEGRRIRKAPARFAPTPPARCTCPVVPGRRVVCTCQPRGLTWAVWARSVIVTAVLCTLAGFLAGWQVGR